MSTLCLRVEFLLKTDSGVFKDTGVNKPWQPLGIPSAITPISQLHQSPPSPIPGCYCFVINLFWGFERFHFFNVAMVDHHSHISTYIYTHIHKCNFIRAQSCGISIYDKPLNLHAHIHMHMCVYTRSQMQLRMRKDLWHQHLSASAPISAHAVAQEEHGLGRYWGGLGGLGQKPTKSSKTTVAMWHINRNFPHPHKTRTKPPSRTHAHRHTRTPSHAFSHTSLASCILSEMFACCPLHNNVCALLAFVYIHQI